MNKFTSVLFTTLCAAALLTGCAGKDGDPGPAGATGATGATGPAGPTGPAAPVLTGSIIGFVNSYDESGSPVSKSGVTVTIDNTTPAITATTNADGKFEFSAVKAGTYNLSFTRSGYGTIRRFGLAHVGGDQPTYLGVYSISQAATSKIESFTFGTTVASNYINYTVSMKDLPVSSPTARFIIFVNNTETVSSSNALYSTSWSSSSNSVSAYLYKSSLNSSGMASGNVAYAIVYPMPNFSTTYQDATTGRTVYTNLGTPSAVVRFIVP